MIPEAIKKFFEKILESILKPILDWILNLNWLKRVLCLLICGIIGYSIYRNDDIMFVYNHFDNYKNIWNSSSDQIILADDKKNKLNKLIAEITNVLYNSEYFKMGDSEGKYNAWTISQILVSTKSKNTISRGSSYCNYISKPKFSFVPNCCCYTETNKGESYGHAIVTSWVMLTLADLKVNLKDSLLNYVLENQNKDGWWSLYPSGNMKDASTLSTAFFSLALKKNLMNVSAEKKLSLNLAIMRALQWLKSHCDSPSKLWFDYPNAEGAEKNEIVGVNGFTLHVINELENRKESLKDINNNWLKYFDFKLSHPGMGQESLINEETMNYNVLSQSVSHHNISLLSEGFEHDTGDIYNLPWFILATKDAYQSADMFTKVKILNFFDDIIEQCDKLYNNAKVNTSPWLAAEFLIALRGINNEKVL